MTQDTLWSRRSFLQGIGYTSALGVVNKMVPGNAQAQQFPSVPSPARGFAYVGFDDGAASGIHVFEVRSHQWDRKQSLPSLSPASITIHPNRQFLYVANEIGEYENLPRGTVEAYKIDTNGTLALINRQSLSLSGIHPRNLAVSPDGNHLVAAIHGGGAYNVLPLLSDGSVGGVSHIVKEVGAGSHPERQASAHPHTIAFDATGQYLLATDEGCDRISVFSFQDGRMTRTHQMLSQPASGPGHLALHPSGRFLYVANIFDKSIDCFARFADAKYLTHQQRVATSAENPYLLLSSSGRYLYSAGNEQISAWKIDQQTGELFAIQKLNLQNRSVCALVLSQTGEQLWLADHCQHEVLSIPVDVDSGQMAAAVSVTKIASLKNIALKNI